MRIGIYDPYLDTLGGGERYILSIASCLSENHRVEVFWHDSSLITKASEKLNINLAKIRVSPNIFSRDVTLPQRFIKTSSYDAIIFLSDGSIPMLFAKKNIVLFQFPVNWVKGYSITNKIKLKKIDKIICYTEFVKKYLDKTFYKNSQVLYPPVEIFGNTEKKENTILTVGRFTKGMNMKKQDVLIDVFKKMQKNSLADWRLVLIGSYLPDDKDFIEKLRKSVVGYPIEIIVNATFADLKSYYRKAKMYWHAAGYGEDLEVHPERAEHFGISTAEAMGAGCVPVVINAGGQKEIVTNGKNGYLWNSLSELENLTNKLIEDERLWESLSKNASVRAADFDKEKFCNSINKLIEE